MKSKGQQQAKKIIIEISTDLENGPPPVVKGVFANGEMVTFKRAKNLKSVPKMKDMEHPPKFLDATSITVVRTNPCGWVKIGNVWYWRCW